MSTDTVTYSHASLQVQWPQNCAPQLFPGKKVKTLHILVSMYKHLHVNLRLSSYYIYEGKLHDEGANFKTLCSIATSRKMLHSFATSRKMLHSIATSRKTERVGSEETNNTKHNAAFICCQPTYPTMRERTPSGPSIPCPGHYLAERGCDAAQQHDLAVEGV